MCIRDSIIINQGTIVADDTADHLTQALNEEKEYIIRVAGEEQQVLQVLQSLDHMREILSCGSKEEGSCDFILHPETGTEIRFALFHLLAEQDVYKRQFNCSYYNNQPIFR